MRHINIVYLLAIGTVVLLFQLYQRYGRHTAFFYGFAENKETELNIDQPVQIDTVFVTSGQRVQAGAPLLQVSRSSLDLKMGELSSRVEELSTAEALRRADLLATIRKLEAQKALKESEINAEIRQLEAALARNRNLVKSLESIEAGERDQSAVSPTEVRIAGLREELAAALQPLDAEIAKLREELDAVDTPLRIQQRRLGEEMNYYRQERGKLTVFAPVNGVVGNILVKAGENIDAFGPLITFYEENPTFVKGYVHESLILQVDVNDTIEVVSSMQSGHRCRGVVTGLGSRIVEIPERLRKFPEFRIYGREILIEIPADNRFLQKEKVMLTLPEKMR